MTPPHRVAGGHRARAAIATVVPPLLMLLYLMLAPAWLQAAETASARDLRAWERILDRGERALAAGRLRADAVRRIWDEVEPVRVLARADQRAWKDEVKAQKQLLAALGAAPASGQPAEPADVARRRAALDKALATADGRARSAGLIVKRADAVLERLAQVRFQQRTRSLLTRGPSPLDLEVWNAARSQLQAFAARLQVPAAVHTARPPLPAVLLLLVLLAGIAAGAAQAMRALQARYGRDPTVEDPPYPRRVLAALTVAVGRGLLPAFFVSVVLALAWVYHVKDLVDPRIGTPTGIITAVVTLLVGSAFVRAAFSPLSPQWRLLPVSAQASRTMGHRLYLLVVVLAADIALRQMFDFGTGPAEDLASVYSFCANTLACLLLLSVNIGSLWRPEAPGGTVRRPGTLWRTVRAATIAIAILTPVANLAGYAGLAEAVLHSALRTALVVSVLIAAHVALREILGEALARDTGTAAALRQRMALTADGARVLGFWLSLAADVLLLAVGLFGLLWAFGLEADDVERWRTGLTQGVAFGSYTIAPFDLAVALLAFIAIQALTRASQQVIERRVFPQTRFDIGVRTAINAGVRYLGLTIALLAAIAILGIDLTKLAIIAGALSVGIGFGLQNVVNNFVSGLILLVERPIKIGDWIVVGDIQGTVRRINVRATQIETAQRADVIVPNANLLQAAVTNWTLRDRQGRVEVQLLVSYATEIADAEELLRAAAAAEPRVRADPAPQVLLTRFADAGIEFELRAFVDEVETKARVESDLRKDILRRTRDAGIELGYPKAVQPLRGYAAGGATPMSP
ncbi:MAG: DUF3772 domain-containing protein [Gammaproteobacteria bacterium]